MEPIKQSSEDDSEKLDQLRDAANQQNEESGLSKKRKIQIVVVAAFGLVFVALVLLLSGGHKVGKQGKAVPASNRGLMQAEDIRRQKELFDQKKNGSDEEQWTKRIHALRDGASKPDTMPDPVALFPENRKQFSDPAGNINKPNPTGEATLLSDSLGEGFQVSKPSNQKFGGVNFKARMPFTSGGNPHETPGEPQSFKQSSQMTERMSDEYQKALAYNASEQLVFTRDRGDEQKPAAAVPKTMPTSPGLGTKVAVSAGDELRAVLTESISSDYPSVVKATLTSPAELSGSTLLLSYSLGEERVATQVVKLILPKKDGDRAKEMTLAAVVKNGLPGLGGDVSHHWIPQIAAGLANAGLTAGALAYASQNQNKDLGTAVLVAPMIEQSVQGVLKPINYLGRDRPVTVTVPAGTEFTLLVTEGFEVEL